jgi:hypothetical protein
VSTSAASVWPHFCLSQLRRPACDVIADSPSSAIKSSSFAGVVHRVAATQVYWPKGLSLIAFRRGKLSRQGEDLALGSGNSSVSALIITEISSWLFRSALRILHAILSGLLRLVSGQSAIRVPFHSHLARHCHRSKACHCKSPRYLGSGCSCRQFPSLILHHLQNLHPRSFHQDVCLDV